MVRRGEGGAERAVCSKSSKQIIMESVSDMWADLHDIQALELASLVPLFWVLMKMLLSLILHRLSQNRTLNIHYNNCILCGNL